MRFGSFRDFHKAVSRLQMLYEVSMHSYKLFNNEGRKTLKNKANKSAVLAMPLDTKVASRSLKTLTFHARDVYPQLLRATLLVRLVTSYEVFLVGIIEEVFHRNENLLINDSKVDINQAHLLKLSNNGKLQHYLISKITRGLTSGGFEEIIKFYRKQFSLEVNPSGVQLSELKEIHERRHLHVHRAGRADSQYLHSHPSVGLRINQTVPVPEVYLLQAFNFLSRSADHISAFLESKYPDTPKWEYLYGTSKISPTSSHFLVSADIINEDKVVKLLDLSHVMTSGKLLKELVVWRAILKNRVRWNIFMEGDECTAFFKILSQHIYAGDLENLESVSLSKNRSQSPGAILNTGEPFGIDIDMESSLTIQPPT